MYLLSKRKWLVNKKMLSDVLITTSAECLSNCMKSLPNTKKTFCEVVIKDNQETAEEYSLFKIFEKYQMF